LHRRPRQNADRAHAALLVDHRHAAQECSNIECRGLVYCPGGWPCGDGQRIKNKGSFDCRGLDRRVDQSTMTRLASGTALGRRLMSEPSQRSRLRVGTEWHSEIGIDRIHVRIVLQRQGAGVRGIRIFKLQPVVFGPSALLRTLRRGVWPAPQFSSPASARRSTVGDGFGDEASLLFLAER